MRAGDFVVFPMAGPAPNPRDGEADPAPQCFVLIPWIKSLFCSVHLVSLGSSGWSVVTESNGLKEEHKQISPGLE